MPNEHVSNTLDYFGPDIVLAAIGLIDGKPDFKHFSLVIKGGAEAGQLAAELLNLKEGDDLLITCETPELPKGSV